MALPLSSSPNPGSAAARQRDLRRHYKESPPPAGVIALRDLAEGTVYLAASGNAQGPLNRHRFQLDLGQHRHKCLQSPWSARGVEGFRLEIVDTVRRRPDPAFDEAAELQALLTLWHEEFDRDGVVVETLKAAPGPTAMATRISS